MPMTKDLRVVDRTFFDTATTVVQLSKRLPCDPDTLFRVLADAPAWAGWLGASSVEYTSEAPYGIGTTRRVVLRKQNIDEHFIVWEPGKRMAFYVSATSLPLGAFAEDFQISPVDNGHSVMTWTTAIEGRPKLLSSSLGIAIRANGNKAMDRLTTFIVENKKRYAATS